MGRLAEKSDASVVALLRTARATFGRRGYAHTSLDGIAGDAKMTKGAVYHHFGSKDALFEAVFRVEHRRLIDLVVWKSRGAADPMDALLKGVRVYLHELLDPTARRILLQDGPSVLGWERWRRCEEPGFQQLLEASLRTALKRGMLRKDVRPAESALLLLGAMTEGALAVAHSKTPAATARRLANEIAVHVRGLCV